MSSDVITSCGCWSLQELVVALHCEVVNMCLVSAQADGHVVTFLGVSGERRKAIWPRDTTNATGNPWRLFTVQTVRILVWNVNNVRYP